MRSISLVEKIELDYKGSVFQNGMCLLDIDNDEHNEICVCNTDGDLYVFKGIESNKPCFVNKDIGSIVILCGGRLTNDGDNVLCAIDTEGYTSVYNTDIHNGDNTINVEETLSKSPSDSFSTSTSPKELNLYHKEKLSPNSKVGLLQDIDNDGKAELIIGYTDRFVRIFKWQVNDSPQLSARSGSISSSKDEHIEQRKATLSFTLSLSKDQKQNEPSPKIDLNLLDQFSTSSCKKVKQSSGSFVLYKQFSLLAQLGSIAICETSEGLNQLIVSQPNGGYCILGVYNQDKNSFSDSEDSHAPSPTSQVLENYPSFYPINQKSSRSSSHTDTQIIGGIKRNGKETGVLGLCTQDGHFMVLDNSMSCSLNPLKNISNHRWFGMSKIDATNNGNDEIVLCSMNGMTYIIDKERDIVSFNFNENVASFCAGNYGISETKSSPTLCYVTLSGRIYIYYNVWISAMKVKCVHGALIDKIQEREDLHYILEMFKLPNGEIDHQKIQGLVKNIWSEQL